MSLRKSPTLTPKMLAAKRRNTRRSTGPTTALGFAGEDTRATEGPTTALGFAGQDTRATESPCDVPTAGKPCVTHYWVSGDLKSGKTPLIAAHGGPGCTHDYLLGLSALTVRHGIPIVFYDQIGNGLSTHLPEKMGDTSFWKTELFIAELENLISALGIQDRFDLFGHSWGGRLMMSFAVRQPKGLRQLVLASCVPVMKDFMEVSFPPAHPSLPPTKK